MQLYLEGNLNFAIAMAVKQEATAVSLWQIDTHEPLGHVHLCSLKEGSFLVQWPHLFGFFAP